MPKISALPPMTTADAADEAPIVDTSATTTKKWTLTLLKTYLQSLTAWVTSTMVAGIDKSLLTTDSNPYKFYAYKTSAQSLTISTFTVVGVNIEVFDTNGNYDNATNYRYTAPVSGFYFFKAQAADDTGANGIFIPSLFKNGTEYTRGTDIRVSVASRCVGVQDLIQLTAGDYVDFRVFADSGTPLDVSARHLNIFNGFMISRT